VSMALRRGEQVPLLVSPVWGTKEAAGTKRPPPPRLFLTDLGQGVPRTRSKLYADGRLGAGAPPRDPQNGQSRIPARQALSRNLAGRNA